MYAIRQGQGLKGPKSPCSHYIRYVKYTYGRRSSFGARSRQHLNYLHLVEPPEEVQGKLLGRAAAKLHRVDR